MEPRTTIYGAAAICCLYFVASMPAPASDWEPSERPIAQGVGAIHIELNARIPRLTSTGDLVINVHFAGGPLGVKSIYNPSLNGLVPLPGQLAVFDSRQQYRGDLLRPALSAPRQVPNIGSWASIPERCYLGTKINISRKIVPGGHETAKELTPGKYYLQFIANDLLLSDSPTPLPKTAEGLIPKRHDCGRSNTIEVLVE